MVTDLTPKEKKTIDYYDTTAPQWASTHQTVGFWAPIMDRYHELLPSGKLLEIGSGGGRDAKELIAHGYSYIGTDVSEGLLGVAKENNPGATFLKQSVYELDFPKDAFDGFWASAVLLHVPKDRIQEALAKLHFVTKNSGLGFITLKQGKGEAEDERGRHFSYYSEEEFKKILLDNRFEIVEFTSKPMSEKTTWLAFIVKVLK